MSFTYTFYDQALRQAFMNVFIVFKSESFNFIFTQIFDLSIPEYLICQSPLSEIRDNIFGTFLV